MLRINLNSVAIVSDGLVKLALLTVSEAAIVIKVGLGRLNLYSMREALDGSVIVPSAVQRDALVVVGVGVLRVDLDGL